MKRTIALLLSLLAPLPVSAATKIWVKSAPSGPYYWSTPYNWADSAPPVDGDDLEFYDYSTINDLVGLDLGSITLNTVEGGQFTGNAITLSRGLTVNERRSYVYRGTKWKIPITLTASQSIRTENNTGIEMTAPIDVNGHTLTIDTGVGGATLAGSGTVLIRQSLGVVAGPTFTGTYVLSGGTLTVNGSSGGSAVTGIGTVTGAGTLPAVSLTGILDPNVYEGVASTVALTTGALSLDGGALHIDIRRRPQAPATEFDVVHVNGSITLRDTALRLNVPYVFPQAGEPLTIVTNDGTDAVSGTFAGLPEGSIVSTVQGTRGPSFRISYVGGDGNDIAVTPIATGVKSWTGAAGALWSSPGNWSDGVAPADGDQLVFPRASTRGTLTNDIAGLDLESIYFQQNAGPVIIEGNGITLRNGLVASPGGYRGMIWRTDIGLTATQTFSVGRTEIAGRLLLNTHTLMAGEGITFSGSIEESGAIILRRNRFGLPARISGSAAFVGRVLVDGGTLHLDGRISGASLVVQNGGRLTGVQGTADETELIDTDLEPGPADGVAVATTLSFGPLTMTGGRLEVDVDASTNPPKHDQLVVNGPVVLDGPKLEVGRFWPPHLPMTIIANDGTDPVIGTFADMPEQTMVTMYYGGKSAPMRITYTGGDGNDVVLMPSRRVRGDFDNDGRADLMWRNNATGENVVWLMNGLVPKSGAFIATASSNTILAGHGDVDGNGTNDVIWRDPVTGENFVWLMQAYAAVHGRQLPTVDPSFKLAAMADITRDGRADLIWRKDATGETIFWTMAGMQITESRTFASPHLFRLAGTGDFDSNGADDILWRHPDTGQNFLWMMPADPLAPWREPYRTVMVPTASTDFDLASTQDFNGDGNADLLWHRDDTGQNVLWLMNGGEAASGSFLWSIDPNYDFAGGGDVNGDGRGDILWRNPTTGQNVVWLMDGYGVVGGNFLTTVQTSFGLVSPRGR